MKIRNRTLMKGSLPALATAFLCTSGALGQAHDGVGYIGAGWTSGASHPLATPITNNDDLRVTRGHGTCIITNQRGQWFDMSNDALWGWAGEYLTLKAIDFTLHSSNNPNGQVYDIGVYQDLTPLTSEGTCHATTFPGPDEASLLLIWEEETFLPADSYACSVGNCPPRPDGDRSISFDGPTGGGILFAPDLAIFIVVSHPGDAVARMGMNDFGEIGDGLAPDYVTPDPAGNASQTWTNHTNCATGGCGSFDWTTDLEANSAHHDFVLQAWFELGDTTNPPPLQFCPGDFTGSTPGEPDGIVNVLDLLEMLSNWGDLAPPRPLGDIRPLFNGDNTVNVLDLLGLLSEWGDCPIPYANCAALIALPPEAPNPGAITGTGSTDFELLPSYMDGDQRGPTNSLSVVFSGNSTAFWLNFGPGGILGPADEGPGPFQFGDSFGIDMGLFGPYAPPYFVGGDAWYLYTADCNGNAIFSVDSTCSGGDLVDSQLEIFPYTEVCPVWQDSISWGNDEGGCGPGWHATATVPVLEGERFLVRIGGWGGESGTATLSYDCRDNSFCDSAIAIDDAPYDLSVSGSTAGALIPGETYDDEIFEGPIACGPGQSVGGRWYSVIGDGTEYTASTCATTAFESTTPGEAALFDSMISVYCATLDTDCEDLTCVVGQNGDTSCNLHETVTWCTREDQVYYILVHGNPGVIGPPFFSEGFFILDVTPGEESCAGALACGVARPSNDDCADAIDLVPDVDGGPGDYSDVDIDGEPTLIADGIIHTNTPITDPSPFAGAVGPTGVTLTNVNATTDGPDLSGACGITRDDLWFTYTANVFLSEVVFSTCNTAFFDTQIEVFDPNLIDCATLTESVPPITTTDALITCSDDDSGCGGFTTSTDPIIAFDGDSFLVRLGNPGFGTGEGIFQLRVEQTEIFTLCPDPCPEGAYVETETLLDDGDEDTTNGGCNMCTPLYDALIDPDDEVTLGQVCGQISTFQTDPDIDPCDATPDNGFVIDMRDTDWYEINVPDLPGDNNTSRGARTTITVASEFPGTFGVVGACDIGAPGVETPFLYSEVTPGICFPTSLTVDLETGTYYVVITSTLTTGLEVGGDGSTHDGHDYIITVGEYEESHLAPLNDECVDAFVVAATSSTIVDNRYATNDGVDDAPLACWYTTVGQFGSVWYKFEATDPTATVETCVGFGGGDTSMGAYSGTCGSLVEIACGEDDCNGFLSQMNLTGLTATTEYYILLTGWSSGDRDFYQMDITSP